MSPQSVSPPIPTRSRSAARLWLVLAPALLASVLAALMIGPLTIEPSQLLASLGLRDGKPLTAAQQLALLDLRLPRVTLAVAIGAALATCGAAMQSLVRNPLADPGLIGISAGAAMAASLWIALGGSLLLLGVHALSLAALVGGALSAWMVIRLSIVSGQTQIVTLLLAGLAINATAGAVIGLASLIADDPGLRSVTYWLFGSLGRASWDEILWGLPMIVAPACLLPLLASRLNALLLGEAEAFHLGVAVESLKRSVLALIVLGVAGSVALSGLIGFIGLIVPHLARSLVGPDHRRLLPAAAGLGALLLLIADSCARSLIAPAEIPVGIFTALIGGPFFIGMLLRARRTNLLAT